MLLKLVSLGVLGGMAELDRTSIFHGLLSEPIVLSPLAGYILGDWALGFKVGVLLQLFFLGNASMGGSSPPDAAMSAMATVISASLAARYFSISSEIAVPIAILVVMFPASMVGKAIDMWQKESNVALLNNTEEKIGSDGAAAVEKAVWISIAENFAIYTGAVVIVTAIGTLSTGLVLYFLPQSWWYGIKITGDLLLLASAGIALASLRGRWSVLVYVSAGICFWIFVMSIR